jgi:hypothetical protein
VPITVVGRNRASMSFLRHTGIYRDGRGSDSPAAPSLIDSMSSQLAIPGGLLSSRAHFRFTNRQTLCDTTSAGASLP